MADDNSAVSEPAVSERPPLPQLVSELWELIVAYCKQETVVPLRALGRYLAFGLLGALLLGIGAAFLTLSGLRALQTETGDTFRGDWSWAPYAIVIAVLILAAAVTWMGRGSLRHEGQARQGRHA